MDSKTSKNAKGDITKLDVAKVLGMDKDYEEGKLEGGVKEFYEELLKEDEEKKLSEMFSFEDQFAFPGDYYTAKMLLQKLNEKTGMARMVNKQPDVQKLIEFCDKYSIEIVGFDVSKYETSDDPDEPPVTHFMGRIKKPGNSKDNQWAANNAEIASHIMEGNSVTPVIRINRKVISQVFSPEVAQSDQVHPFDVSFRGDPMTEILAGELLQPVGYCMECGGSEFSFNGEFQSCIACGSRLILRTHSQFTVTKGLLKKLCAFQLSIF
jgi:hypothetical protein